MSSSVTLTASMRTNLLNLQQTQDLFNTTQERLSTGKKVNSALDNPSSYFTAQSLTARADSLESLLDSMGQAVQTITAADDSITSLQTLVDQAKALANNAKDTANTATSATGDVNLKPVGAVTELGGVAVGDTFSIRLGSGDEVTGTKNVTLTQKLSDIGFTSTGAISIKVGDGNFVTVTANASDTVESFAKRINENTRLKGLVTASVEDGKFSIKSSDAKNAITVQAITTTGSATTTTANSVTKAFGLDEGFKIDIKAAGQATVAGVTATEDVDATGASLLTDVGFAVGETVTITTTSGGASDTATYTITATSTLTGLAAGLAADGATVTVSDNTIQIAMGATASAAITGTAASKLGFAAITSGTTSNSVGYSEAVNATGGTTLIGLGVSPTPAKIRASVGENIVDITLDGDNTLTNLTTELAKVGLTATITNGVMSLTGEAGKAIKVEDVTGNLASTLGIATSDYIKPETGGIDDLVDRINQLSTDISASIDKNGYLKISATNGEQLTITDVATNNGTGKTGTAASALGVSGLADNGTNTRKSYAEQFDSIMGQIDQMVTNADTSYKGVNLLNGDDLTVNFNEDRTSSLLIKGSVLDSKGLGLNETKNEWKTATDIDRALSDIDTASARLETKASELGQNLSIIQTRQDFTENMVNTLTTGADDLTLADMNEEAANLLALQTRQQLATNALSLASQSQQSVLSLF